MPIDWDALANKAAQQTDNEFSDELAKLTSLNTTEITNFIAESSISNANAVKVLQEINNATRTNNQKATAIASIDNGVGFLVSLVGKVV
ncbi:hypothetical protein GCM10011344_45440 [Dokdonia pacifica]|uniref:Uncharacterized protein n=1 Tax=Dokdonia pacifica TaxID=1627892 RepID=A0A239CTK7_9FLAO|nr:hypothetical protein [Dokdonia pacifica]GGG39506.1 hypothetical protein GCM10011344_45440 [Dokdonia pacifica]SNS23279.1 hypothetical protein SAMN06265376_108176 [Dokdonia pacifica]